MRTQGRFRWPLVRVGMTLMIGGLLVALVSAYVALGESAANLNGPDDVPQSRQQFVDAVKDRLLHGPGLPRVLLGLGIVFCVLGLLRLAARAARGVLKKP